MKTMYKDYQATAMSWNGATWDLINANGAPDFQDLGANNPTIAHYTGYFDLAGLTQQEKTLFIQGINVQLANTPTMNNASVGDAVQIAVLLSDTPIPNVTSFANPGYLGSGIDAQNLIYHSVQTYAVTQDYGANSAFTVLMNEAAGGVCTSTASDRIYFGVLLLSSVVKVGAVTSNVDFINFPALRIKLYVNAVEEKEYQYLMRLKRSYDLQQSFDVDGNRPH